MAFFDPTDSLTYIKTLLLGLNIFENVQIGEPLSPPESMTAAIFMVDGGETGATLGGSLEDHVVMVRIYRIGLSEPVDQAELDTAKAVSNVLNTLAGHFTLNSTVRAIDFAGENGDKVTWKFGHLDVSGTVFRVADIRLPLIVDDSASYVA